ncbi:MAG TPA: rhodanese-like domain-containing protein [Pyrinomonadaceae bacterium]|nr:rhodanese-like domain-containing protein [Pyrinomonadaceae bacterium]
MGIAIEESHQAHLSSYGIKNVPTLALLDRNGVVNNVWVGKLPPKTESEVMQTLGMQDTRPTEDWLVNQHEIERRRNQGEKLIVVDLRDRNVYALNHLPNTMNIPLDELNARAKNELPQDATVVLYSDDNAVADRSYRILSRQDFPRVLILDQK